MNTLLIFFAIPLATIILSAILETFIHNPIKVAGIFFSIFIVVAFALGGTTELIVAAIIYTIISFLTAVAVHVFLYRNDYDNTVNYVNNYSSGLNMTDSTEKTIIDNNEVTNDLITNEVESNNRRCRRYR